MLFDITKPITNWIFPPRCVACNNDTTTDGLCAACRSMITIIPAVLNKPHERPALFFYEGVIRQLIMKAKFHRGLHHAKVLIDLCEQAILAHDERVLKFLQARAPDCVSVVSTHWFSRLERGIDLPQLFALMLARRLAIPLVMSLKRNSYFHRQSRMQRKSERIEGITGAFSISRQRALGRAVLVDDIVTTGATFDESKKMLKKISSDITCLAIARTP